MCEDRKKKRELRLGREVASISHRHIKCHNPGTHTRFFSFHPQPPTLQASKQTNSFTMTFIRPAFSPLIRFSPLTRVSRNSITSPLGVRIGGHPATSRSGTGVLLIRPTIFHSDVRVHAVPAASPFHLNRPVGTLAARSINIKKALAFAFDKHFHSVSQASYPP